MMDWLSATTALPRWVVWAALLTHPSVWSREFVGLVRRHFPTRREEAE